MMTASNKEDRAQGRFGALANWLRHMLGTRNEASLRETLEDVIEEHEETTGDALAAEERSMLVNVLAIGDTRVADIMVPRADIVALEADTQLNDAIAAFRAAHHSRMPIYRETLDDPLGMIHLKDVVAWIADRGLAKAASHPFSLAALKREVLFVPTTMPALDLLQKMRQTRIHMALVIDEYGGTDGLITVEDLLEEIVGEIKDEHEDSDEPLLLPGPDGSFDADALVTIEAAAERLGLRLDFEPEEEVVDTLGGLVVALVGRVPIKGEHLVHPSGLKIEVLDADPRRVKKLRLKPVISPAVESDLPEA